MSVAWTITPPGGGAPVALADLGLTLAAGQWSLMAPSVLRLDVDAAFDRDPDYLWAYRDQVTLYRDGARYFYGLVNRTARMARPGESISVHLADPWWWLESLVYQQSYASLAEGSVQMPFVVLGLSAAGAVRTTTQQVADIIDYAIAAGAPLVRGDIDPGIALWPVELRNVTCAEAIRLMMRHHPQWSVYLDHSTNPYPTIHVRARAELEQTDLTLGLHDLSSFNLRPRDDLRPDAVRIVYHTANQIDGEIYRATAEDIYPPDKTGQELGALNYVVELEGMAMQFNKQEIQAVTIPDGPPAGGFFDQQDAKDFLKLFFDELNDLNDADWKFQSWSKTLAPETANQDNDPDPVNPNATRLRVETVDDLPRALIRGAVQDWMRVRVGQVLLKADIILKPAALAALDAAGRKFWGADCARHVEFRVTGTNARTKLYKGKAFWQPAEQAPVDLARALYMERETLEWEGSLTLPASDLPATRYHGTRLRLRNSLDAWSTMDAVVNRVGWDVDRGQLDLEFGPAARAHLGPQDLVEQMRAERKLRATWWSSEERASNTHSATSHAGSRGDTITPFDFPAPAVAPANTPTRRADFGAVRPRSLLRVSATTGKLILEPISLLELTENSAGAHQPKIGATSLYATPAPELDLAAGDNELWVVFALDDDKAIDGDVLLTIGAPPAGTGQVSWKVATIALPADGDLTWLDAAPWLVWVVHPSETTSP